VLISSNRCLGPQTGIPTFLRAVGDAIVPIRLDGFHLSYDITVSAASVIIHLYECKTVRMYDCGSLREAAGTKSIPTLLREIGTFGGNIFEFNGWSTGFDVGM
jgi:hypothetical protein